MINTEFIILPRPGRVEISTRAVNFCGVGIKKIFIRSSGVPTKKNIFPSGSTREFFFGSRSSKFFCARKFHPQKKFFLSSNRRAPGGIRRSPRIPSRGHRGARDFYCARKKSSRKSFFPCGFSSLRIRSSKIFLRSEILLRKKIFFLVEPARTRRNPAESTNPLARPSRSSRLFLRPKKILSKKIFFPCSFCLFGSVAQKFLALGKTPHKTRAPASEKFVKKLFFSGNFFRDP